MSEKLIPEHIDPYRYAEQDLRIEGKAKLSAMERLNKLVLPSDSEAHVKLRFGVDEQGITYIKGQLKCDLTLQCQRCMEPFIREIISDFALGIVKTFEKANELPQHYEPALAKEDNSISLSDLIEDELILNLPIIPKHEEEACNVKLPLKEDLERETEESQNPFKVLESLKHKQESGEK